MVDPLVRNTQRPFRSFQHRQAVFCQDGKPIGRNHFRDAMVNLRVDMIRPSRQNNACFPVVLDPLQGFPALFLYIIFRTGLFLPGFPHCFSDFPFRNVPLFFTYLDQPFRSGFFTGKGNKWPNKMHFSTCNRLHVVLQIFRIRDHDRAVEVILRCRALLPLIKHARVENRFDSAANQPLHMAV